MLADVATSLTQAATALAGIASEDERGTRAAEWIEWSRRLLTAHSEWGARIGARPGVTLRERAGEGAVRAEGAVVVGLEIDEHAGRIRGRRRPVNVRPRCRTAQPPVGDGEGE